MSLPDYNRTILGTFSPYPSTEISSNCGYSGMRNMEEIENIEQASESEIDTRSHEG